MIKITELNKVYKSKKRKKCHALMDISITLPDNGLVFVLGKSGSGKSTLLNIIGGLDSITSGRVVVDGNDLSAFRERDFCNYRNNHIGFIFQDYHLIDELTIYDNIVLSLNLRRMDDREKVLAALDRVDLAGYEDRYPSELSGGERQRVAIARAIVKSPRIILADEPTGNLDTNTATQIINLLHRLSKDCLILVVSHNINDADSYADRIIELKKGQVISDRIRNPQFLDEVTVEGDRLVYPQGLALSDSDISLLNANKHAEIIKKTDKFLPTPAHIDGHTKVNIDHKSLTLGKQAALSAKFLKNKLFAIVTSAIIVSVVMVIMAMAQTIINFDAGRILREEMSKNNQSSMLLNKTVDDETRAMLEGDYRVAVGEDDIQTLIDEGYKGMVYPVYNSSVSVTTENNAAGISSSFFKNGIYLTETMGTMIVDEAFLYKKFGDFEYAAKLDKPDPAGVIITDYMADAILSLAPSNAYVGVDYDALLGEYGMRELKRCFINGIINTGYKDKYSQLFERITNREFKNKSELFKDEDFMAFSFEVSDSLGYAYSFNENFVDAYSLKFASRYPYTQKLMVNGIAPLAEGRYVVKGLTPKIQKLVNDWAYTLEPPIIPEGAKYVKVAFGNRQHREDADTSGEGYFLLLRKKATLEFSNGYIPDVSVLNYEKGVWLNPLTGETKNMGESFNFSWVSDFIEIPDGCTMTKLETYAEKNHAFCAFYDENREFISSYAAATAQNRVAMEPQTVHMGVEFYNSIFGTEYNESNLDTFKPHKAVLTQYRRYDVDMANPLAAMEVTIKALMGASTIYVSQDLAETLGRTEVYANALYIDGTDGIEAVLRLMDDLNYEQQSVTLEGVHTMTKAIDVFVPIFRIVATFLCAAVVFIMMNFSTKMIRDKMHEIGILKALGTKNTTIGVVFGLQIALIAFLTCILSTVGYYFLIDFANEVLFESMKQLVPSQVVLDLDFFEYMPSTAAANCILIAVLSCVAMIIPLAKIKAIKPVKIIKSKD